MDTAIKRHVENKYEHIVAIYIPPTCGFGVVQVHVGHEGCAAAYPSTIEPRLNLRGLLVEPLDGCHRTVQNSQWYTMIDNLEKSETGGGASDLVNNKGATRRVNAREIDGWDEIGSGNWGGFELGQDLRRVNEEAWDCGDAGVEKAFYSELGFVELLNSFHSVVFFIVGRQCCHGVSLSLSL